MTKNYYLPWLEFCIFTVATILIGFGFYKGVNHWLSLLLVVFAYVLTLGNSYIIRLTNEKIVITPLSPFRSKHSIDLDSIHKIQSLESYTFESDLTLENTYPTFKKKYYLEYIDIRHQKKIAYFSINNKAKEKELINAIKNRMT